MKEVKKMAQGYMHIDKVERNHLNMTAKGPNVNIIMKDNFMNIGNINALEDKRGLKFTGFGINKEGKLYMSMEVM
jgi:hypothetical protein